MNIRKLPTIRLESVIHEAEAIDEEESIASGLEELKLNTSNNLEVPVNKIYHILERDSSARSNKELDTLNVYFTE